MAFASVPSIERRPWGLMALVLNILPVAGVGSILAGLKGRHGPCLVVGLLQCLIDVAGVAVVFVGAGDWPVPFVFGAWLWSIIWGVRIFRTSHD